MEPTLSPIMRDDAWWTISEAATYMQDILIGQATWRYRIGRDFEHLLAQVDGLSLTWEEDTFANVHGEWKFVFSLRRKGHWKKALYVIDKGEFIASGERVVQFAAYSLAHEVVRQAFPEVAADEDRRREEEGVNLDE